jgi:hypothetical protein
MDIQGRTCRITAHITATRNECSLNKFLVLFADYALGAKILGYDRGANTRMHMSFLLFMFCENTLLEIEIELVGKTIYTVTMS